MKLDVSANFFSTFTLKDGTSWTWENSSSATNTATNKAAQALTLHKPSATYAGPTLVYVYIDKIYKTEMFSYLPPLVSTAKCLGCSSEPGLPGCP